MPATPTRQFLLPLATGLGYFLGAKLGVWASALSEGISIFWPPNSVLLAALLLTPKRRWPWHLLAIIPAEIIADLPVFTLFQALNFAVVNILEVCLAAVLLRRIADPFALDRSRHVVWFGLIAMFLASTTAALLGAAVYLQTTASATGYWTYWRIWWFGDGLGLLIFTPLLLSWLSQDRQELAPRALEGIVLLVITLGFGAFTFSVAPHEMSSLPHSPILLLPLSIWAAIRFGLRGASTIGLIISLLAIYYTQRHTGPFANGNPTESVLHLQEYLFVVVLPALAIAALLRELHDHTELLQRSAAALKNAQAALQAANLELEHKVKQRTRELEALNAQLEKQALMDTLTDIPNRRHFMAQAGIEVARARRYGHPLSLLMLDIDFFKAINDRHGHAEGDRALIAVAHAIRDTLRASDLPARIGGEEFAALLPDTDRAQAADLAERLRGAIETLDLPCAEGTIAITISGGLATLRQTDRDIEPLLKRADDALYQSKAHGRNRIMCG